MQNILVTGGAGFIGSHLCRYLLRQNRRVICLDNLWTGKENNIKDLLQNPLFKFVHHDVCIPYDFPVDAIFNLACPASPKYYQSNPVHTVKTNVLGALHALELAQSRGIPVLQASTSEVYGDPHIHPQIEKYWGHVNPIGFRSCYDEGKRCAETLFFDYYRMFGVQIKVARIFNTYGPFMQKEDGRVVSNFISQALCNQSITLYGTGDQTRSFCYIDDLVAALLAFMNTSSDCIGPINLGNPEEFRVIDLAYMILDYTQSRSSILFKPLPEDDPRQRRPDISLAMNCLGWKPEVALSEGIQKTIKHFKSDLGLIPLK